MPDERRVEGCLIWSFEHAAWWAPAERGYTQSVREAGQYTLERGAEIVEKANRYTKKPNEALVPAYLFPVIAHIENVGHGNLRRPS